MNLTGTRRLQWGHGDGAVEETRSRRRRDPIRRASMGPRRWSRGRARSPGDRARRLQGRFNGATAMEPWKRLPLLVVSFRMLSLQWGHGDGAVEETGGLLSLRPKLKRFNGATAMEPWKSPDLQPLAITIEWLQWGHGDGAVEESGSLERKLAATRASMGPRRWSRGRVLAKCVVRVEPRASMGPRRWSRGRALG